VRVFVGNRRDTGIVPDQHAERQVDPRLGVSLHDRGADRGVAENHDDLVRKIQSHECSASSVIDDCEDLNAPARQRRLQRLHRRRDRRHSCHNLQVTTHRPHAAPAMVSAEGSVSAL
jgi:hypothetical protein